jgi:hypothetical protein
MNLKELGEALKELAAYIEWERESIEDFHRYGHTFGASPGSNVFTFVLQDALRQRGMTLDQFRDFRSRER